MAKNRMDKISKLEAQIAEQQEQLKKEKKKQAEEARKAKTKRQIARHGLLESMLPEVINLTDEQYKTFLTKHVANDYGRKTLASISAQGTKAVAEKQDTATAPSDNATP